MKLDLHGTKHERARNAVIRAIEDLWGSDTYLDVITGHSTNMKNIAIKVIEEYGLEFQIGGFDGVNQGFIRVLVD